MFNEILNKQMSRSEFLKYFGIVLLTVLGITSLINSISGLNVGSQSKSYKKGPASFGSGAYGA